MNKINLFCMYLLYAAHISDALKILVVFPLPGKSHSFLGAGVARHLAEAGHEVTFITPFPSSEIQHPLLREIDVSSMSQWLKNTEDMINIEKLMNKEVDLGDITNLITIFLEAHVSMLENENVKKLLNDPKELFDVVIVEWMFNELSSGISAVFNCPYIWVSSTDPHWMVFKLIDELPNPAYTSDATSSIVVPFPFTQRVKELLKQTAGLTYQRLSVASREHEAYKRLLVPIIQKRGHKVPDFEEIRYNASLMLGNSHVSMGSSIRLPQNYKSVGGYHIDTKLKPLPADLKKLLDNAKNGLIYFSMGSNLKSQHLPAEIKTNLLKVFGKLKQTVLWKFEENLPNRPSNVHIVQWAPQHSILAHPNCILFITHGGLLSTTEAIHFGKPIIGIPVFGDQFANVDKAVIRGFAKRVDLTYTMPDELAKTIADINNPSFAAKAKELSIIYHDRPVPPGKELVHWVEHVVRTGGAPHLRSPALLVPWYQKCYLDLAILIILIIYTLKFIVKKVIRSVFSNNDRKQKRH